jgi:hypothetical protein
LIAYMMVVEMVDLMDQMKVELIVDGWHDGLVEGCKDG